MESTRNCYSINNIFAPVNKPLLTLYRGVSHGCKSKFSIRCSKMNSNTLGLCSPIIERRSADYKPSIWNIEFLETLRKDHLAQSDEYEKLEALTCEVKKIVADERLELSIVLLQLIDDIQRLGLEIYFGEDVKIVLSKLAHDFDGVDLDLQSTALGFRLLRQSGVFISQDIFLKFMDEKGTNFLPAICNDHMGMIQLYEASYLSFEGEQILAEAKAFTKKHLNTMCLMNQDTLISDYVNRTLDGLPLRYRLPRLEARHHFETNLRTREYTKHGTILLELAKLDYNLKQSIYQEELQDMARWWKDLGLSNNLTFARDRLMECYFWGLNTTSTPELYSCRKALTKVYNFITIIDDIYDVYGQLHELELFTNAIERWDINVINDLPDYMKLSYLALYNTINEIGYEVLKEKGHNCVPFLKKAWEDMCKAFLVEAKWFHYKQTPTFEEYIKNGWVSISGVLALTHAFFFVSSDITPEALQCFNNHDVLRLPSMVFRLANDLATSEAEIERGETTNAITCYAKQAGISHKEARKHIRKMIDESWKSLNALQVSNKTPFSKDFIESAINIARTSQCTYQHGDGHSSPELLKNKILSIIIQPIQ